MRFLGSSKCLKTTVELIFTTQKANTCSPWTACSAFNWKYLFWVNLVQKLEIISLNWNFVPRLIRLCRIPWWCSLFLFSTGNTFLGKFGPEKQMVILMFILLCFRPKVYLFLEICPKNQNYLLKLNLESRSIWTCRTRW